MTAPDLPLPAALACGACKAPLVAPFRYCGACGTESDDRCESCGLPLQAGDSICASCNAPRTRPDGTPTPVGRNTWDVLLKRLREGLHGEFRVTRELGRGGQAAVYLADELALRRQVAIKVLARGNYVDDGTVARFQDEARTIAGFRHPHIVTVYSIRKLGALPFFIMQYLEGRSLAAVLRTDGPLPWSLARAVLYQVGSALEYAHQRGVVHRDIKPANIIFDSDGNAVVTDFGIAKKVNETANVSTSGMLVGTPAYMSPEQCHGDAVTPASDQYGLGVVAYELITGRVPFQGTELVVMHGHAEGVVPSLRQFSPECPPALESTILRMLAKTPAQRFPTLHAALDALGAQMLHDDDPVRHAMQELAMHDGNGRGRSLTPTFGFAAPRELRYVLKAPERLQTNEGAVCEVVLADGDETDHQGNAREFPVDLRIAWSVSPTTGGRIDITTGQLVAQQAGPLTVRAIVAGQVLTGICQVDGVSLDQAPSALLATLAPTPAATQGNAEMMPPAAPAMAGLMSYPAAQPSTSRARAYGAIGAVVVVAIAAGAFALRETPSRQPEQKVIVPPPDTPTVHAAETTVSGSIDGVPSRLTVGDDGQASPRWDDPAGGALVASSVRWTSDDPSVLRLNARTGAYVATGAGKALVALSVDERRVATRTVNVSRVKQITYTFGNNRFLSVGESRTVTVRLLDSQGNLLDPASVTLSFSAVPASVLRVDDSGHVTGISEGTGTVTIKADGRPISFEVRVEPIGP